MNENTTPHRSGGARVGAAGARLGRDLSEDVAGRYERVTVFRRRRSRLRQIVILSAWTLFYPPLVLGGITGSPATQAVDWVRTAPAEELVAAAMSVGIGVWLVGVLGMTLGLVLGSRGRDRLYYVSTSEVDADLREPRITPTPESP